MSGRSTDDVFTQPPGRTTGHGRRAILPCLLFFLGSLLFLPIASQAEGYLAHLLEKARDRQLHDQRYWDILLHYKPGFTGRSSLVDDPRFFLDEQGKNDPAAELEATLKAFFATQDAGEEHPRCRFVARYAWLEEQLEIDPSRLPEVNCEEFEGAFSKVRPRSASLIFPGNHNNSPASMFGHTLINIAGPYKSKLLSWAVNYSAFTDETNGFSYAVKGIFGLYRGYYSILPYYQKVKEYNDLERRDIWEYELNLDPAETTRMFLHIWELRDIYSDYFFFDENCSYNLLFLLEAARPSLRLTDACRPWVIPIDTVRIARESGLIEKSVYRPSKATRVSHIAARMNREEKEAALKSLDGSLAPQQLESLGIAPEGQKRILDLAAETVEFRYFRKEMSQEAYRTEYLGLLKARSRLGPPEENPFLSNPGRPDRGHGSNRFGVGIGWWKDDYFQSLRIRPAYHNLMDADAGYLAGSQIDFTNLELRWYPGRGKVELHTFDLVDIVSLSPRSAFFKPISWKVDTGFIQKSFRGGEDHLIYRLNPGGGFAWDLPVGLTYLMLETDAQVGGRFRDNYALGFGGSAGFMKDFAGRYKVHLRARQIYFELGDPHRALGVDVSQNLALSSSHSLSMDISRNKEFGEYFSEAVFFWNFFW